MIRVVIDTNILVSALLSPSGNPAKVFDHIINGNIVMCYDSRMITEYQEVLMRPKFGFDKKAVRQIIDFIIHTGISIVPVPLSDAFEDDKIFYEVAKTANAHLVTGNTKHFPDDPIIITPHALLRMIDKAYKN